MILKDYFDWWDDFFEVWKASKNQNDYQNSIDCILKDPISSSFAYPYRIENCSCKSTETFEYIPEPYWGWTPDTKHKLKVVVVNYNPASGGKNQHKTANAICEISRYSEYVSNQIIEFDNFIKKGSENIMPNQYETSNWHNNRRALKLLKITQADIKNEYPHPINNYLGIELVPWHTANVAALRGYLLANFNSICQYSLNFAFEASKTIEGSFKNIVLVRTSWLTFKEIFQDQLKTGFFINRIGDRSNEQSGRNKWKIIEVKNYPEIQIYLLWGMRNDLPDYTFLNHTVFNSILTP